MRRSSFVPFPRGTDSEITDADVDLILSRGREMTTAETDKLKQTAGNDLLNFSLSNDQQTNFQVFEGSSHAPLGSLARLLLMILRSR